MAKYSHRTVKTLVHYMPESPANSYFLFSPPPDHGMEIRGAILEIYGTMGGRRPRDMSRWAQRKEERRVSSLSCSLSSYQNEKKCSCFILQQNQEWRRVQICIFIQIHQPHTTSLMETVPDTVSQTDPLTCRTAQSVSCPKILILLLPPNTLVAGSCSSFRF